MQAYLKAVELLIELASLQTAFLTLDEAIKTTNRRVNALDNVVVPRLENTISYIKASPSASSGLLSRLTTWTMVSHYIAGVGLSAPAAGARLSDVTAAWQCCAALLPRNHASCLSSAVALAPALLGSLTVSAGAPFCAEESQEVHHEHGRSPEGVSGAHRGSWTSWSARSSFG